MHSCFSGGRAGLLKLFKSNRRKVKDAGSIFAKDLAESLRILHRRRHFSYKA
jgi:hypothetical protein